MQHNARVADAVPLEIARSARPDMSVLKAGRRNPPKFPVEALGLFWGCWVEEMAEAASAPADYVAAPLLASAAALIGNSCAVSPFPNWTEPSVLWTAAVGDPSSGKSPGAAPVSRAIAMLEAERNLGFDDRHRDWLTKQEFALAVEAAWKTELKIAQKAGRSAPARPDAANIPPEPQRPRLRIADSTPEALASILSGNPRGLLMQRDELAGWLSGMDRYSGGGSERPMWLEAYGAGRYVVDRVRHKGQPIVIPRMSVSICGTVQPDRLAELLKSADDGLAARFLWFWPSPVSFKRSNRAIDDAVAVGAMRQLLDIEPEINGAGEIVPRVLPFTPEGADYFEDWIKLSDTELPPGLLGSAQGKARGHIARLALVLEMLKWTERTDRTPPTSISAEAVRNAAQLITDYFWPMAERVAGDAALLPKDRHAAQIAKKIIRERVETVNASQIRSERWIGRVEASVVQDAIEVLVEANWLTPCPSRHADNPGRPRADYRVNPRVSGGI